MNIFIILLFIFIIIELLVSRKIQIRARDYDKRRKSNPILQYDKSCEIITSMAIEYRRHISTMSLEDFLGENYICRPKDITDIEQQWFCFIIDLYELTICSDTLATIFGNNGIWYSIPLAYTKEFLTQWKEQNQTSYSNQMLANKLKKVIELKIIILSDKDGNSYSSYTNKQAIDHVAKVFNMPSCEEYQKIYCKPYESLADLCRAYMRRFAKQNKFKYVPLNMICENPTDEQKQIQYNKTSDEEKILNNIKAQAKIMDKYDL